MEIELNTTFWVLLATIDYEAMTAAAHPKSAAVALAEPAAISAAAAEPPAAQNSQLGGSLP
ncbi:MAG: hypothetical protein ABI970_13125 [Chloroflexota bacterium]|nr:hypothetical protein [Anaerolineae bacterium]